MQNNNWSVPQVCQKIDTVYAGGEALFFNDLIILIKIGAPGAIRTRGLCLRRAVQGIAGDVSSLATRARTVACKALALRWSRLPDI